MNDVDLGRKDDGATPGRVGASVNQPEMTAASQESGTPGIWSRHQARGKGYRSLTFRSSSVPEPPSPTHSVSKNANEPRDMSQTPESRLSLSLKHYTGPARRGAWTRPQLPARRANATERAGAMRGRAHPLAFPAPQGEIVSAGLRYPSACRPVLWPWDALRCSHLRGQALGSPLGR